MFVCEFGLVLNVCLYVVTHVVGCVCLCVFNDTGDELF